MTLKALLHGKEVFRITNVCCQNRIKQIKKNVERDCETNKIEYVVEKG